MQYLRIKNYDKYQHYKDRNPPWVKLYRCILHDYDLRSLTIQSRLAYVFLLIIASETDNRIPNDPKYFSDRFGFEVTEQTITPLIDSGFLLASGARRVLAHSETSSSLLSSVLTSVLTSSSESDLKSKTYTEEFEQFWLAYPRKVGKKNALKAWINAKDKPDVQTLLEAIVRSQSSEQWQKDGGQFIPHPSTWLTQGRWTDQPTVKPPSTLDKFLSRQPYRKDLT